MGYRIMSLVKHYIHTMQGIPQLSNTWGSMIALLDAILVTGFNFIPVTSITRNNNQATIRFALNHGFLERQVIRITGSTNGWDGDYKVFSVTSDTVTILCEETLPLTAQGSVICSTAPLDFEIAFTTTNGSATAKRAYRSTAPDSLGLMLLVHDFVATGGASAGAKFAKVAVVSEMSNVDTITGVQMPFNSSIPNANWEYSSGSHGWAKWYYKVPNPTSANIAVDMRDSSAPSAGNSPFYIAGNDKSFAIHVCPITSPTVYISYGFFQFYDEVIGRDNQLLLAFGIEKRVAQTEYLTTMIRDGLALHHFEPTGEPVVPASMHGAVWFNGNGVENYQLLGQPLHYMQKRGTELLTSPNAGLQDIVITDASGAIRGVVPFFKYQLGTPKMEYLKQLDNSYNLSGFAVVSGFYVTSRTALSLEGM